MESFIQIFNKDNLSNETKIELIIELGKAINYEQGANVTEGLVYKLVLALDPEHEIRHDVHYATRSKSTFVEKMPCEREFDESHYNKSAHKICIDKLNRANERIVEFEDIKKGHLEYVESLKQLLAKKEDQYKLAREIASKLEKNISVKDSEIEKLKNKYTYLEKDFEHEKAISHERAMEILNLQSQFDRKDKEIAELKKELEGYHRKSYLNQLHENNQKLQAKCDEYEALLKDIVDPSRGRQADWSGDEISALLKKHQERDKHEKK